ncbi:MAG TPA: DUF6491 family protein [Steroidobacteraceae bacterium]|nr:DUF6491 family protein [Steroidobacteraceae bacterium]
MTFTSGLLGAVAAVAISAASVFFLQLNDAEDARELAQLAPPARDALVQPVDLTRIAGFRYVDDRTIEVTDARGRDFRVEFTEDCPGLKDANDFSLVTESYRDLDRFTGIALQGRICTFNDFAPRTP